MGGERLSRGSTRLVTCIRGEVRGWMPNSDMPPSPAPPSSPFSPLALTSDRSPSAEEERLDRMACRCGSVAEWGRGGE